MTRSSNINAMATGAVLALGFGLTTATPATAQSQTPAVYTSPRTPSQVTFGSIEVDGLNIAYREAGDPSLPRLVLLHGFPAS